MAKAKQAKGNKSNNNNKAKTKANMNKNVIKTSNKKPEIAKNEENAKNNFIMKVLVFLGVLIFGFIIIYLMYHFFVEKSDIKINMSTDKKAEYITIEGVEELILTQKYVSDLGYSMRYDVDDYKVFKYKTQDIYKNLNDERILVVVEKSTLPTNCTKTTANNEYNNCYIKLDNYTEEFFISLNAKVYKVTIKTPGTPEHIESTRTRIDYMLNSFKIEK